MAKNIFRKYECAIRIAVTEFQNVESWILHDKQKWDAQSGLVYLATRVMLEIQH